MKQTVVIDFDGTIHSYEHGWQEGRIYGTPIAGFFEWAAEAKKYFVLAVYSTRSESHKGLKPMIDWMTIHLKAWHWEREDLGKEKLDLDMTDFLFPTKKPPALASIDDRAITFRGDWRALELQPHNLMQFKSWVQKEQGNGPVTKT